VEYPTWESWRLLKENSVLKPRAMRLKREAGEMPAWEGAASRTEGLEEGEVVARESWARTGRTMSRRSAAQAVCSAEGRKRERRCKRRSMPVVTASILSGARGGVKEKFDGPPGVSAR